MTTLAERLASRYKDATPVHSDAYLPAADCSLVTVVLQMYWIMQHHAQQAGAPTSSYSFPGFDGNNETAHMAYARFVVRDEGRLDDLAVVSEDLNSHKPTPSKYHAMLGKHLPWLSDNARSKAMSIAELDELRVTATPLDSTFASPP